MTSKLVAVKALGTRAAVPPGGRQSTGYLPTAFLHGGVGDGAATGVGVDQQDLALATAVSTTKFKRRLCCVLAGL